MKKLLGSTLALALMFSGMGQANAELLKNFKLGGQIDVQATSARNVTDFATRANATGLPAGGNNDRIGDAQTRVMLHMDWDLLDDVHAKVTLRKNDRTYGTAAGTAQGIGGAGGSQPIDGSGAGTVLGSIAVDQASFKIDKLGGSVDATFGRQFYGNSGDMVVYFGPSDKALYGLPTTSIDAVRFDWGTENVGVTGVVGKTVGSALGVAGANTDLRGIAVMCKQHEMGTTGVYLWNRVTHGTGAMGAPPTTAAVGGKNDNLYVVGVKAKLKSDMGWLGGEFAKNFGDNRAGASGSLTTADAARYTGWAFKVDAGMKADMGMAALTPWLHFGYGKGDSRTRDNKNEAFTAISPDYRPGSIYGRFAVAAAGASLGSGIAGLGAASNSLSNRVIWGAGVKATPSNMNKLTVGVSWYDFKFQKYATAPDASAANAGNRHIGSEIDLDLTWAHSENVTLGAGVASFQPGGAIKEANKGIGGAPLGQQPANPATLAYMDVRVRF